MRLVELNLFGNKISEIDGLSKLPLLRKLDLSKNQVQSLNGLVDLIALRELRLSDNNIKRVRELGYLENLVYLSILDLCFNDIQNRRFYRMQVLYRLPGLRTLDGVQVASEEIVKAENLYGMDLEDRRRIFNEILPDEEFIDRRINIAEVIEPETESDKEDRDLIDQYDEDGRLIHKPSRSVFDGSQQKSLSDMYHTGKSLQERSDTVLSSQQQRNSQNF